MLSKGTRSMRLPIATLLMVVIFGIFGMAVGQTTITVAQQADEATLEPNMIVSGTGFNMTVNMFDTLYARDDEGNLVPSLAVSAEAVDDTTWELKLREGVVFHNGEVFDANDVKATLDRITDPEANYPRGNYVGSVTDVQVVGPYTVRIITGEPDPTLMEKLLFVPIEPDQYYEEKGREYVAQNPVGTGPFKFVEWRKGEQVVLEAFEDHWRGRPQIDRVVFRVIPETASIMAALQTGEVDIITNVPPDQAEFLESQNGIDVRSAESSRTIAIALPTEKAPYDNKLVRQALNYGVNVDEIVEFLFEGYARPVPTFLAPMYHGYNADLEPYPHDPERARELLAEAGYPDGFTGVLYTPTGRYPKDREVAEVIANQLQQIGVNLEVTPLEWGNMMTMYRESTLNEPFLLGYGTPIWDSGAAFFSRMHSDSYSSYYNNPEVDALIEEGTATVDAEKRGDIYERINAIIHDDPSHIFMYQQIDLYGVRDQVNWEPRSDERIWLFETTVGDQ